MRIERCRGRLGFCQTEVEQLGSGLCQHHVARLEITMRNACAMRGCECIRNIDRVPQCLLQRQRSSHQPRLQRLTFDVLHHEEVRTLVTAYIK